MSLRQMEYLLAVVEEGSFTRAARRLDVSQPALSHQIRALERTVGAPLLERLPNAVHLTAMGRAYLPHAAAALRSAAAARRVGRGGEPEDEVLRIVTFYSLALGILPPAIRAWRAQHSAARIELREFGNAEQLSAYMALGLADVGVGSRPREWHGDVRPIGAEELVIVLAREDPLARDGAAPLPLARLADRAWVLYDAENGLTPIIAQECAAAGFAPRAAVRTRHTASAAQLAAAGLGPALVPRSIIERDFAGAIRLPDPPIRRELVAISPQGAGRLVATFVDVLAAHGAERARRRR